MPALPRSSLSHEPASRRIFFVSGAVFASCIDALHANKSACFLVGFIVTKLWFNVIELQFQSSTIRGWQMAYVNQARQANKTGGPGAYGPALTFTGSITIALIALAFAGT